jgi:hypothetical protein
MRLTMKTHNNEHESRRAPPMAAPVAGLELIRGGALVLALVVLVGCGQATTEVGGPAEASVDVDLDDAEVDPLALSVLTTYRASTDFSSTQGSRGWRYRFRSSGALHNMTYDAANARWVGNEPYLSLWRAGSHPGDLGNAVLEWTAPRAGVAKVGGTIGDAHVGCGDGVFAAIKHNDVSVWNGHFGDGGKPATSPEVSLTVAQGDTLRFGVAKGDDNFCDATSWDPTIALSSEPPPPARRTTLGLNSVFTIWNSPDAQLAGIRATQTAWVREASTGRASDALWAGLVRKFNDRGVKVLMTYNLLCEDTGLSSCWPSNGGALRAFCSDGGGNSPIGVVAPLSRVSEAKFKDNLNARLGALKNAGARIDAAELGNELDWVCFNPELSIDGPTPNSIVTAGAAKYAALLRIFHSAVKLSYPNATIVTFGGVNAPEGNRGAIAPSRLLLPLKNVGGVNYLAQYANALGLHAYTGRASTSSVQSHIRRFSTAVVSGQPIWITEWGYTTVEYPSPSGGRPNEARYQAFRTFMNAAQNMSDVRVQTAFLYAYSDGAWSVSDSAFNPLYEAKIAKEFATGF